MTMLCGLNMSCSQAHFQAKQQRFLEGGIEVLDEHLLHQSGSFKRVRRWLRGHHPKLGLLSFGYTGPETIQEVDVIIAMQVFTVLPANAVAA